MAKTRTESDSLGDVTVPAEALYGAQTQRACDNFTISGERMPESFIRVLILLKACAAKANQNLNCISGDTAFAITQACESLLADKKLMDHFPVDVFQTGSGTSTNMNANEVIANLATHNTGENIHANDHVNFGQSSNDVIPSTLHITAALNLHTHLLPALSHLEEVIQAKAASVKTVCKTGRTHLMDAMPVRLEQSLMSWFGQLQHHSRQLQQLAPSLHQIALGGTAVGTGVNAHPRFAHECCNVLSVKTGLDFKPADNPFPLMSGLDAVMSVSGQLKSLAMALLKIANDLRWMNSGPLSGLGEIELAALQPGSSIMPGKVNPVIPEAVAMAAAQVAGYDSAITIAGQSGNFELNVMLPLMANNLLKSMHLLTTSMMHLADKAIKDFSVKHKSIEQNLARNPVLVTALNPIIGYSKAAEIAKRAWQQERPVMDVAAEMTDLSEEELKGLLDPMKLTYPSVEPDKKD